MTNFNSFIEIVTMLLFSFIVICFISNIYGVAIVLMLNIVYFIVATYKQLNKASK